MNKTAVHVPEQIEKKLKKRKQQTGLKKAEIHRRALAEYLEV